MHIVVCIKQVPDSAQIRVHPVTNTIMRQGVPAIINPFDLAAIEEALQLKDRYGARVTVLTMGPPQAEAALRKAIAYGADDVVLLTDRAFAGADTLATSFALAQAIRKLGEEEAVDLVMTGKQTIDGDTAQVGPGIAKRLDLQLLTYVSEITDLDLSAGKITVQRRSEGGVQVIKTRLPALITMLESSNTIRFASMPNMFRAERQVVPQWNRDRAGIEDASKIGLKGSPTVVSKIFTPRPSSQRAKMVGADLDATGVANAVLDVLSSDHPRFAREIGLVTP